MEAKMTAAEVASFLGITLQAVHKKLKAKNLEFKKSQNRIYFGHETARKLYQHPFQHKVIAFQIVKGGTGKTSLAYSIAIRAHLYGARVLCVDLDQQANLTQALQINAEELPVMVDIIKGEAEFSNSIVSVVPGLDLVPSRIENAILDNVIMLERLALDRVYQKEFNQYKDTYDLIVIDCPPALGQSVAAIALASDVIIAPVTPEEFSLSGLKITYQELLDLEEKYQRKIELKLVLNKFDTRTALSHEVLSTLIKHNIFGDKLYKSYIRASQEFPNTLSNAQTIFDTFRITPAKEDIDLLTREILHLNNRASQTISLGKLSEDENTLTAA